MFGIVNYKTTLTGAAAILAGLAHLLTSVAGGDFNTAVMDAGIVFAGLQGMFAKDNNVTGGTVSNATGNTITNPVRQ
jgi:hypothetical protein